MKKELVRWRDGGGTAAGRISSSVPQGAKPLEIDVELLLRWAYGQQRVDKVVAADPWTRIERGLSYRGVSPDGCARIGEIHALGCSVDTSGPAFGGSTDADEDALAVHDAVDALHGPSRAQVIVHARHGDRPVWDLGPQRWRAVPGVYDAAKAAHRPKIEHAAWDRHHRYGACLVELIPSNEAIQAHRDAYANWWNAVETVAEILRGAGTLRRHVVTGPAAPRTPWRPKA